MEKRGKVALSLFTAALILIGGVTFAGFHQAARWQAAVRKEIGRLDWAVPLGHYDYLGGGVLYHDGEPYFPMAVSLPEDNSNQFIDREGRIYDGEDLRDAFDEEVDEDIDYDLMHKEEGYLFPVGAHWSEELNEAEDKIEKTILVTDSGQVLFETDQFCDVEEIGAGYYTAWPIERGYTDDFKIILKNDITPAFGGSAFISVGSYAEGLCYCEKIINGDMDSVPEHAKTEKGYYDEKGRLAIPTGDSVYGTQFSEGYAVVYEEERFYVVDKKGNKVVEKPLRKTIEKSQSWELSDGGNAHWKDRFVVFDGKYYGVMDIEGRWLIKPMFYDVNVTGNKDFFTVYFGDKKGIVDLGKGEMA